MAGAVTEPLDRDRLAHVLDRLGSEFDGEVIAAGRAADRIVRLAGLTWEEVLRGGGDTPQSHLDDVDLCLGAASGLTDWEVGFLRSVAGRARISPRQREILRDIVAKIRHGMAA